jgi:hypothetical protein
MASERAPTARNENVRAPLGERPTIEGSSKFDTIFGGSGTDKAEVNPGDYYESIEIFI